MIDVYNRTGANVLTCIKVENDEDFKRYGIVAGEPAEDGLLKVSTIVEKPGKANAPSNLASVSGYIFKPELFEYLQKARDNVKTGEEFVQQPSIQQMIDDGHVVYGLEVQNGKYYDTGNKLEYLKTVVDFALEHDDLKDDFLGHLRSVVKEADS